jgi:hypothetical protein
MQQIRQMVRKPVQQPGIPRQLQLIYEVLDARGAGNWLGQVRENTNKKEGKNRGDMDKEKESERKRKKNIYR